MPRRSILETCIAWNNLMRDVLKSTMPAGGNKKPKKVKRVMGRKKTVQIKRVAGQKKTASSKRVRGGK